MREVKTGQCCAFLRFGNFPEKFFFGVGERILKVVGLWIFGLDHFVGWRFLLQKFFKNFARQTAPAQSAFYGRHHGVRGYGWPYIGRGYLGFLAALCIMSVTNIAIIFVGLVVLANYFCIILFFKTT